LVKAFESFFTLLPEGRNFGVITQKRPKTFMAGKKIRGRNIAELSKMWQQRGRKIFLKLFRGETI
jgi:hypothetical protein